MCANSIAVFASFFVASMASGGSGPGAEAICDWGSEQRAVSLARLDFDSHLSAYRFDGETRDVVKYLTSIENYDTLLSRDGDDHIIVTFLARPTARGMFRGPGAKYFIGECGTRIMVVKGKLPVG